MHPELTQGSGLSKSEHHGPEIILDKDSKTEAMASLACR